MSRYKQNLILQALFLLSITAAILPARGAAMTADAYSELIYAVRSGDPAKVAPLVEKGADINAKDEKGNTPLHLAAYNGFTETVRLLVDKGADINAVNNSLDTPLMLASHRKKAVTAILLIEKKADINAKNKLGENALHITLRERSYDTARLLIEKGADINAKDKSGTTALHMAVFDLDGKNREIALKLIEKGAGINAKNIRGYTPLHFLRGYRMDDIIIKLAAKGADINAKSIGGETPLHIMAQNDFQGYVRLIIDLGADVNARDNSGATPLNYAADRNARRAAEVLIKHGALKVFRSAKDMPFCLYCGQNNYSYGYDGTLTSNDIKKTAAYIYAQKNSAATAPKGNDDFEAGISKERGTPLLKCEDCDDHYLVICLNCQKTVYISGFYSFDDGVELICYHCKSRFKMTKSHPDFDRLKLLSK